MTETDELPLSNLDRKLQEALKPAKGLVRAAASNAIVHIQKAWGLRAIDPEMAVFRGITAEEEAATALIACVQELRYPNADKLKRHNHAHKLGLFAFFGMINNHFAGLQPQVPSRLRLKTKEGEAPQLTVELNTPRGWAEPVPPLHFSILEEDRGGPRYDFRREVEKFLEHNGLSDFRAHLKRIAHQRNHLLYASYEGRPGLVGDHSDWLLRARDRTYVLLRALCLVFPHRDHQLLVQQCIDGFLAAVEGIDYDSLLEQS